MKSKLKMINEKFPEITREVNKLLEEKFALSGIHVSQINFSEVEECPPGFEQVCKFFGTDPVTGKPIIKCKCVRIRLK